MLSMFMFTYFVVMMLEYREQYSYATRVLVLYMAIINLYGLLIMYVDKKRAKKGAKHNNQRVSERHLFIVTALGGFLGTILGMRLLRHKTKKTYFKLLFPCILLVEVGVIVFYYVPSYIQ